MLQRDRVHDIVCRSTGTIVAGGYIMEEPSPLDGFDLSKGAFYAPTVITDVDLKDEVWTEEIFGPVVVVQKFRVGDSLQAFFISIYSAHAALE